MHLMHFSTHCMNEEHITSYKDSTCCLEGEHCLSGVQTPLLRKFKSKYTNPAYHQSQLLHAKVTGPSYGANCKLCEIYQK